MAGAADPDPPPPPKTSLFLACFGFSGKRTDNSSKRRRSAFLPKQSAAAKSALKRRPAAVAPPPVKAPEEQTPLETESSDKRVTVEDGRRAVSVSQPGSPDGSNRETMTRATSLPDRVGSKIPPREITASDKLEPVMGLSIVVVTLVIMLIWGRLFAVLCTFTWLYFVPRPRRKPDLTDSSVFSELELEEHVKKRVVFEGFLKKSRNHSF